MEDQVPTCASPCGLVVSGPLVGSSFTEVCGRLQAGDISASAMKGYILMRTGLPPCPCLSCKVPTGKTSALPKPQRVEHHYMSYNIAWVCSRPLCLSLCKHTMVFAQSRSHLIKQFSEAAQSLNDVTVTVPTMLQSNIPWNSQLWSSGGSCQGEVQGHPKLGSVPRACSLCHVCCLCPKR